MNRNDFEILSKAGLVFRIIWLVIAIALFTVGAVVYAHHYNNGGSVGGWFIWGGFCTIPVIGRVLARISGAARQGEEDGRKDIYATVEGNRIEFHDRSGSGWLIGGIVSIIISLLIGPIHLGYHMIMNLIAIIRYLLGK